MEPYEYYDRAQVVGLHIRSLPRTGCSGSTFEIEIERNAAGRHGGDDASLGVLRDQKMDDVHFVYCVLMPM